jgi:hypothetical protein
MSFRLSRHAREEMIRRQIPSEWVDALLDVPEQTIEQPGGTEIRQSRFTTRDGKMYLVRAVVATAKQPAVVVTVYRTSKIEKYWKGEIS